MNTPVIIADVNDKESLEKMARRAKIGLYLPLGSS